MHVGIFYPDHVKFIRGHSVHKKLGRNSSRVSPTQHRSLGKLYARDIISYVRIIIYYVGVSKYYIGDSIFYVGDKKSYV